MLLIYSFNTNFVEVLAPIYIGISVGNHSRIGIRRIVLIEGVIRIKKKLADIIARNIKSILSSFGGFEPS